MLVSCWLVGCGSQGTLEQRQMIASYRVISTLTPDGCTYDDDRYSCKSKKQQQYLNGVPLTQSDIVQFYSGGSLSSKDMNVLVNRYYDCGHWSKNYGSQTLRCNYALSSKLMKHLDTKIHPFGRKKGKYVYQLIH